MAKEFTASKITGLITAFETTYRDLADRQDADMKLYELVAEDWLNDSFADNVTFNTPHHEADTIIQLLEASRINVRVHDEKKNAEKEALIEEFLISMFNSADEYNGFKLMPPLKTGLSFWGALRGWMALKTLIYQNKEKEITPDITAVDPRFLSWGVGRDGLTWTNNRMFRLASEIEDEYDYKPSEDESQIDDFWTPKENIVLVDGKEVKREKHNLGYVPFVIHPITTFPKIIGESKATAKYHIKSWGESVFASNRELYRIVNKILTVWLSLAVKSHNPGFWLPTDDTTFTIEETPYGKGTVVTLPGDAKPIPVFPPDIASSVPELFNTFAGALQRGGISWPAGYGQLWKGQELSGEALTQLKRGMDKMTTPLLVGLGTIHSRAARMIEEQFLTYDEEWLAQGIDSKGRHFYRPINPDDLSGNHKLEIEFLSITPEEDTNNYAKAKMIQETGLAGNKYIREKIVQFQDYDLVEKEMREQEAEVLSPKIKMLRTIEALKKQGKKEEAALLTADFLKMLQQEQMSDAAGMKEMADRLQGGGQPTTQPPQGGAPQGQPQGTPQGTPQMGEQEIANRLSSVMGGR